MAEACTMSHGPGELFIQGLQGNWEFTLLYEISHILPFPLLPNRLTRTAYLPLFHVSFAGCARLPTTYLRSELGRKYRMSRILSYFG